MIIESNTTSFAHRAYHPLLARFHEHHDRLYLTFRRRRVALNARKARPELFAAGFVDLEEPFAGPDITIHLPLACIGGLAEIERRSAIAQGDQWRVTLHADHRARSRIDRRSLV